MVNVYELSSQMTRRALLHDHINTTVDAARDALMSGSGPEAVEQAVLILTAAAARYTELSVAVG
jgi:hypothetical protein